LSSAKFETVLVPASRVRNTLLGASAACTATGALLILGLPLRPVVKLTMLGLWLYRGSCELRNRLRGMSRLDRIRIEPSGRVTADRGTGAREPLVLLSGSVVLTRMAWLRVRFPDGLQYGEMLLGNAGRDEQWRRLQLIWRQGMPAFGGPQGS